MSYANVAPTFVNFTARVGAGGVQFTRTAGALPQVGGLLVAVVYGAGTASSPGFTAPAGWELLGQRLGTPQGGMAVFSRRVTDPLEGSYTFGGPGACAGVILQYSPDASGLDGLVRFSAGIGATADAPAMQPATASDRLVVLYASQHGYSFTPPDQTVQLAAARDIGAASVFAFAAPDLGSAAATEALSAPASGTDGWIAAALLIAPEIVPTPTPPPTGAGYGGRPRFSPGPFQPTPVLSLGGLDVAAAPTGDGQPVVVDGLWVDWGRSRLLEQPDPATGQVQLFFASRAGAARWARSDALVGQPATLSYEGSPPGGGPAVRVPFLRARIYEVSLSARNVRDAAGGEVDGAVVTLRLVSVLADLSNVTPGEAWPEETLGARLTRVQSHSAHTTIVLRDFWKTPHVQPAGGSSQRTVLDHVLALYDSCGVDRMTYLPAQAATRPLLRRDYGGLRGLVQLWRDDADDPGPPGRAGRGVYLRPAPVYPAGGGDADVTAAVYLDAAALGYDPAEALALGADNRLTRVEVTNPDAVAAAASSGLPAATSAARAIRDRMNAGDGIAEDWTWPSCPSYVADHNEELLDAYGGDPLNGPAAVAWLTNYVNTHLTDGGGYPARTTVTLLPGINEDVAGIRSATLSTEICQNEWADLAAADLASMAAGEATEWTLHPATWETTRTGGFETVEQARLLLAGAETQDLVFLGRSQLPEYGVRPLFGIMGGRIGWAEGGWVLQMTFAPLRPPDVPQHAVSWPEIDDGTEANRVRVYIDGLDHPDALHESVTCADLLYCALGLGATSPGPDTGWDTIR